jgi:TldD protein
VNTPLIDQEAAVRVAAAAASGCRAEVFAESWVLSRAVAEQDGLRLGQRRREGMGLSLVTAQGVHHRHLPWLATDRLPLLLADHPAAGRDAGRVSSGGWDGPEVATDADLGTAETLARMVGVAAEAAGAAYPGVTTARVTGEFVRRATLVAREDGVLRQEAHSHVELRVTVTARRGGTTARVLRVAGAEVAGPETLATSVGDDRIRAAARAAADVAVRDLDAVDPPSGELPVVLAAGGPGALLHEVCGHGLEADVALQPGAAYGGVLGRRLAPSGLTLIDSPRAPAGAGLYRFDDEGEPAAEVALLEDGVLRSYLHDRRTAGATGAEPHGHGRRLSYAYPALPRMSCTYVAPGTLSPEEIIAATPFGLYVESIVSGETDMSSGRFSVRVTSGRLIENGRLTAPIREATLAGTGLGVLRDIDLIGDDLRFMPYGYQCNKLGQFPLTVSVGQPTLRVAAMAVSGP